MTAFSESKHLTFVNPASYLIKVRGSLDERYFSCLGDMQITVNNREDPSPVTTLVGQVRDQSELMGILNSLYELHLPLMTVEFFN